MAAVCGGLCPEPLLLAELSLDSIETVSENALSLSGLSVRMPLKKYNHRSSIPIFCDDEDEFTENIVSSISYHLHFCRYPCYRWR